MSDIYAWFHTLATSASPEERALAPVFLARNQDRFSTEMADEITRIFREYLPLFSDSVPLVTQTAFSHVSVLLRLHLVHGPSDSYAEIFDRSLFPLFCREIDQVPDAAFRTVLREMRSEEQSERIFRFVVPELLGDSAEREVAVLSKFSVFCEFLLESEVRDFLGPLLESAAADEQSSVRRAAVKAAASLVPRLRPRTSEILVNLSQDPHWTVRLEVARNLYQLVASSEPAARRTHPGVLGAMKAALADASLVVAREASLNVVRWISLLPSTEAVPQELQLEFKEVFSVFLDSGALEESALPLAERFGEALEVLGADKFDEDTFIDAVALFNRSVDVPSQTALARAIPCVQRVAGDAHTFALLDMYIKAHRSTETFEEAVKSLIAVINMTSSLEPNLILRLLLSLSLQPKRHLGAWRRRLILANHLPQLIQASINKFRDTENFADLLRHVLTPLWLRLLCDPAKAVREQVAQISGGIAKTLLLTAEHRKNFLDHVWGVFGASEAGVSRQIFIKLGVSLIDAGFEDEILLARLDLTTPSLPSAPAGPPLGLAIDFSLSESASSARPVSARPRKSPFAEKDERVKWPGSSENQRRLWRAPRTASSPQTDLLHLLPTTKKSARLLRPGITTS